MSNELWRLSPRELRERVGLTQLEVAIALGKQPNTISDWERGTSTPLLYLQEVKIMMRVYQCDLDALIAIFSFNRINPDEI